MIRQNKDVRINKKCTDKTVYVINNKGSIRTFPNCLYFDHLNKKCELNGCIKNSRKEKKDAETEEE